MSMFTAMKVMRKGPAMPGPYRTAAKHKPTLFGKLAMERWVAFSRSVDDRLKTMAQLRTSAIIGCMW
jgi:hypothetical protein